MKQKYIGYIALGLLLGFLSCTSTPPAEDPLTAAMDGPPLQADLSALDAAAARAAAARREALDFNAPLFLPNEWAAADSLYTQAEQGRRSGTRQEALDSAARYNLAADALEALLPRAISEGYDFYDAQLCEAREAAVRAGAEVLAPDHLLHADNTVVRALESYEAGDYTAARDTADEALTMYNAIRVTLEAGNVRERIIELGLTQFDPTNLGLGDDAMRSALLAFDSADYERALEEGETSLHHYSLALNESFRAFAEEVGFEASRERERALELRANIAMRVEFPPVEAIYTRAVSAFEGRRFEEAVTLYLECTPLYRQLSEDTLVKQRLADEAIQLANERMAESDELAREAERILEGGL
ncbi:MAG: hypothetical protein FWH12_00575 [Treponema sp.]|nr:hypothetical protein [Treponema sp.]